MRRVLRGLSPRGALLCAFGEDARPAIPAERSRTAVPDPWRMLSPCAESEAPALFRIFRRAPHTVSIKELYE